MISLFFIILIVSISSVMSSLAFPPVLSTPSPSLLFEGYLKVSKADPYVYPYSLDEICEIFADFSFNTTSRNYYFQTKNIYTGISTHSTIFLSSSSKQVKVHNCFKYNNSSFILFSNAPTQLFIFKDNMMRNITLPYSIRAFHFDHIMEKLYLQSHSDLFKMYLDVLNDLFVYNFTHNPHDFLDLLPEIYLPRNINDLTIINATFYFIADSISPYMNGKSKIEKPPYFRMYKMTDNINHDLLYPISNVSQFNFIPFLTYEKYLSLVEARRNRHTPIEPIAGELLEYILYCTTVTIIALAAYLLKIKWARFNQHRRHHNCCSPREDGPPSHSHEDFELRDLIRTA